MFKAFILSEPSISLHLNYQLASYHICIEIFQENCTEVILSTDVPFRRLDHYKIHEYTKKWNMTQKGMEPISMTMTTSIDAMFKRKRGRPPKNRVIEVINGLLSHFVVG